jgi:hypothetical protein
VDKFSWPFLQVLDARRRSTGWTLLNGPIITQEQQEQFAELRRDNYRFAGMSSYMTFPLTEECDALQYEALCEVWCHCFRDPQQFLSTEIPRSLISVSDFTDYIWVSPQRLVSARGSEEIDFIYAGATEQRKKQVKSWSLAGRCLPRLTEELGLRALVIGTPDDDLAPSPKISFSPHLPWEQLLARLAQARFLFVPNELDASPRLMAEALCLDVPLVVNRRIIGGWKYVNAFTGVFFDSEHDVVDLVRKCLSRRRAPRDWFRTNYGPYLAGQRLLRLLKYVDPGISEQSHLCLDDDSDGLARSPLR